MDYSVRIHVMKVQVVCLLFLRVIHTLTRGIHNIVSRYVDGRTLTCPFRCPARRLLQHIIRPLHGVYRQRSN